MTSHFEAGLQVAQHAFQVAKHDVDGNGKGRAGDANLITARGCARGNTDKLPRFSQTAHHQNKTIKKNIVLAGYCSFRPLRGRTGEQCLDQINLLALERRHYCRQALSDRGKHIAAGENLGKRSYGFYRARHADLRGEIALHALIFLATNDNVGDAEHYTIMQSPHQLFGLQPVVFEQRTIDVGDECLGLGGHQIAPYPIPRRRERRTRDASDALVIGGIVDQERFERREEKAGGIANPRHLLPRGANCPP